jgi:lipopolysaccharide export system protein LptA
MGVRFSQQSDATGYVYHDEAGSNIFSYSATAAVTFAKGVTITTGGVTLTAGNLTLTAGNVTLTSGSLTLTSGGLTLTSGDATLTSGNVLINGTGKGLRVKAGANCRLIQGVTLVAGTVATANTTITANTVILYSMKTPGGTTGNITVTRSNGTSFTLTSSSNTDTSVFDVYLIEAL